MLFIGSYRILESLAMPFRALTFVQKGCSGEELIIDVDLVEAVGVDKIIRIILSTEECQF